MQHERVQLQPRLLSSRLALRPTDPLLGQSLREPVGDELKDVGGLAPAAHAVQQLAVSRHWGSWFHPAQLGKDTAAGREKGRMREGGGTGSPSESKTDKKIKRGGT